MTGVVSCIEIVGWLRGIRCDAPLSLMSQCHTKVVEYGCLRNIYLLTVVGLARYRVKPRGRL